MMNTARRPHKIAALIRGELARILIEEVSDPHLQQMVITEVKVSNDLKNAYIYFDQPFSDAKVLNRSVRKAIPFLKKKIGNHIQLRHIPDLHFEFDKHSESVSKIMHLLDELKTDGMEQPNGRM